MKKPRTASLSGRIIQIVIFSMAVMLLFLFACITRVLRENEIRRQAFIAQAAASIASSLNATGQNIAGMGRYIANFEAFQKLYIADRKQGGDPAGTVASAFHTVRFMADNFPLVQDVIVISTKGVPFSYLSGTQVDLLALISDSYDFYDPSYVQHKFVYFEDRGFFAYIVPISNVYTTTTMTTKSASCVILCDKSYITGMIDDSFSHGNIRYSVFDQQNKLIATNSPGHLPPQQQEDTIAVNAESMGLSVRAYGLDLGMDASSSLLLFFALFSMVILLIVMAAVIILLQRQVAKPIENLVTEMSHWGGTSLRKRLSSSNIREIDRLIAGFNMMLDEIEAYTRKIFHTQEKLYEMELRKNETERYALQSQINPHFLFNTLQCIRSIALVEKVEPIAEISLSMAELFRYSMNYQQTVTLRQEIDILHHYVRISTIRFGTRFQFEFNIEEEILPYAIGPMMLQPLVENAIMHGLANVEEGGRIAISGRLQEGEIQLTVWDNGRGISPKRLEEITHKLEKGFADTLREGESQSFGLYNINRRLKLQFGEEYGLKLLSQNGGTSAILAFPAREV